MAKKKLAEPEAPVETVVDAAPVVEPEPVAEVVEPVDTRVALPLGDGRFVERRREHERTLTIEGVRYEHVSEDADGKWIYARS